MSYCSNCGTEITERVDFCSECGTEVGSEGAVTAEEEYSHPGEEGVAWKHLLKVGVIALLPAIILAIALPSAVSGIGFLVAVPLFTYLGYQRPTAGTAFGRLSFWTAITLFMSPLLMIVHTFIFTETQTQGTAETAGAAIGGTILVLGAFVIGIPLGIGFYLLSRRYSIEE